MLFLIAGEGFKSQHEVGTLNATWDAPTSRNTKRSTVLGASRMKAGVQPLNMNMGPSSWRDFVRTPSTLDEPV
jgi:hypothetical protein